MVDEGNLCSVDAHPGATALVLTVSHTEYATAKLGKACVLCFYNRK